MKNNRILILTCCIFCACSGVKMQEIRDTVSINLQAPEPQLKVNKIVQLESGKDAFYGRFFRVFVTDRNVFVQDMQQILVFDANGKYLSKVDRVGHGPQEYISVSNFWPFQDELYVIDSEKQMVLVYSLSGEFLRSVPLDFRTEALAVTEDYMAFKSAYNQRGTLIVTDRQGKKIYETIDPIQAKTTVSIPAIFPFTETDGKIYYFPDFSSSIYTVGADTSDVKRIRLDFGPHTLTPEYVAALDQQNMMGKLKEDKMIRFANFYPTRQWWGMVFSMGDKEYSWYYDLKNGKQYIASAQGKITRKPIACSDDDQFIEVVDAVEFLENPRYGPYRAGLKVDENDNAILIFYTVE